MSNNGWDADLAMPLPERSRGTKSLTMPVGSISGTDDYSHSSEQD